MKKRILSIIVCLVLLFSLTACGEGGFTPSQKAFDEKVTSNVPSTDETIAQNDRFSLQYDSKTGGVKIIENATGLVWGTTPTSRAELEAAEGEKVPNKKPVVNSALRVAYTNPIISGGALEFRNSFSDVYRAGRMTYTPIENGVTIEYYFDDYKFMVPVSYVLCDDYVSISVDSTKIQENDLKVASVAIAPFLCSVENDTPDSYLFIPSGSGALIGTSSYNNVGLAYEAFVYGDDLSMEAQFDTHDEVDIRMPVYGYKNGNVGGFTIIDNGDDAAKIITTSGNTNYGFSTIYSSFQLRGTSQHLARTYNNTYYTNIYPNNMLEGKFSVRFYPLSGEKANYSSMADIYRDYLVDEKGLTEKGNESAMSVSLIGGTEITKSFVGIPYVTIMATTTLTDANNIVTDLSKTVKNMSVKLKGFGQTGVDIGKIGGGYKLSGNIGSAAQLKNLSDVCKNGKIDLYMDYDLVRFSSSGSGFSFSKDVAMNCGYIKADTFLIDKAIRGTDETEKYRLLRPVEFNTAVQKAVDATTDFGVSGVSLETMSSLSYADYSDYNNTVKYNAKHGFANAVSEAVSKISKNKQKFMATTANAYAAILADIITDVPTTSNDGYAFVEDVPFYSMVFKGYVPMTTESINLADNSQKAKLAAVESGLGLNYTLINNWDNSLISADFPYFYSTKYDYVKDDMIATYNELSGYYESINGAKIISSNVVSAGVHCTTFDNGVTVYVNYNNTATQTPAGEIGALGYIITGGVAQ